MNRRRLLTTSAGFLATMMLPGKWSVLARDIDERPFDFRPYRQGRTLAPTTCITPDDGFYIHTFYDECPWSASGRYFVVTRLPYQGRKPALGDAADVCVIDLERRTIKTIYRSRAWSFQVGANAQWAHTTDRHVYANDLIGGRPVCVRIDHYTGEVVAYSGAKYDLAPDDESVVSPNLETMNVHQYGYSMPDPDPEARTPLAFDETDMTGEGLWCTDLTTDETTLLVPFERFRERLSEPSFYEGAVFYLFHSKFNPQNTRIMQVFRAQFDGEGRNASLFTLGTDGRDLIECISRRQWNRKARLGGSGNHPNWHPNGEYLLMNLIPEWLGYEDMLFCLFRYDGEDFRVLSEKHLGSGHPTIHPSSRYIVTDAYQKQRYVVSEDLEIPIRLIDLEEDREHRLLTISTEVGGDGDSYTTRDREVGGSPHKLDPHPAWNRDYDRLAINGAPEGRRQVFVADLRGLLS